MAICFGICFVGFDCAIWDNGGLVDTPACLIVCITLPMSTIEKLHKFSILWSFFVIIYFLQRGSKDKAAGMK